METLPFEMVLKISGYLTPQDLARCCGVCHNWREIFNDDCHWRPHCDPELAEQAEHLRNTPSVVEPVFVTPEPINDKLSTSIIGDWRLAFLREEHLWKNLKQDNNKKEKLVSLKNECQRDFLTNTLVVRWCLDRIEIWDVSVTPMVLVAKTDVDLGGSLYRSVVGNSMLLVEQKAQIKVFHVDAFNKHVELRHDIPLNEVRGTYVKKGFVKDNIYVRVHPSKSSLEIFDLETGELKRNEPCPDVGNKSGDARIKKIISSPTSDILIVKVSVPADLPIPSMHCQYHFYSLRQLAFLQGPQVDDCYNFAIHEHYLAAFVMDHTCTVKVYDCHKLELIYSKTYIAEKNIGPPCVFNNNFIFTLMTHQLHPQLDMFSLADRTMTTIFAEPIVGGICLETINNKIVYAFAFNKKEVVAVWKATGRTLKRCDLLVRHNLRYNQALTRAMLKDSLTELIHNMYHYW